MPMQNSQTNTALVCTAMGSLRALIAEGIFSSCQDRKALSLPNTYVLAFPKTAVHEDRATLHASNFPLFYMSYPFGHMMLRQASSAVMALSFLASSHGWGGSGRPSRRVSGSWATWSPPGQTAVAEDVAQSLQLVCRGFSAGMARSIPSTALAF